MYLIHFVLSLLNSSNCSVFKCYVDHGCHYFTPSLKENYSSACCSSGTANKELFLISGSTAVPEQCYIFKVQDA